MLGLDLLAAKKEREAEEKQKDVERLPLRAFVVDLARSIKRNPSLWEFDHDRCLTNCIGPGGIEICLILNKISGKSGKPSVEINERERAHLHKAVEKFHWFRLQTRFQFFEEVEARAKIHDS